MNFKRLISFIIVAIVTVLSILWVLKSYRTIKQKENAAHNKEMLSQITKEFKLISSNQADMDLNAQTILIYFNSECEHCREEFEELKKDFSDTLGFQVFLVSYQDANDIYSFVYHYGLRDKSNIFLFQIDSDRVIPTFGKTNVPQIFTYQNNSLLRSYKGKANIKALINSFEK